MDLDDDLDFAEAAILGVCPSCSGKLTTHECKNRDCVRILSGVKPRLSYKTVYHHKGDKLIIDVKGEEGSNIENETYTFLCCNADFHTFEQALALADETERVTDIQWNAVLGGR